MNLGLFAADEVGYEIAKIFRENKVRPRCLVLDSKDPKKLNAVLVSTLSLDEVIYSDDLGSERTLSRLKKMKLDLAILAWWPYILKKSLINIPKQGCLNFHPSYLPHNRGKHPYFWSILEEAPFGVTLHFTDEGIDSGDIAFQEVLPTSWMDTGASRYEQGKQILVDLFKKNFPEILKGNIPRRKQGSNGVTFHRAGEIEEASKINLDKSYKARYLFNLLRARTFPRGACWFVEKGQKYEVRIDIRKAET